MGNQIFGAPDAKSFKDIKEVYGINNKIDENQMEFTMDPTDFIKNPELDSGAKRRNNNFEEVESVA